MFFKQTAYNLDHFRSEIKSSKYLNVKKKILQEVEVRSYGFIEDIFDENLNEIMEISKTLKKFEQVLFLGTGGSSLGGKTLVSVKKNFFSQDNSPKIYFLENVDENSIGKLINKINIDTTAVVAISKSGETIETISQFFFVKNFMKNVKNYKEKFFIVTENKKSSLKKIQETEGFKFYEHKKNIGGRFSIFSLVGLLPASLIDFDVNSFKKGGISFLQNLLDENYKVFDEYFFPSLCMILLSKENHNISVFMPYIDRLNELALWYRQLWAESIGKEKKSITALNALGTVDQHSQLQLFLDGPNDKFFTFIGKKKNEDKHLLDCSYGNKIFNSLHKKSLDQILFAEMKATIETLKKKKLPLRYIELNDVKEMELGALVMFLFIETIFCCYLIDVNPFDQPAVEEGKILTKKILENE